MTASLLLLWREGVRLEAFSGGCRVRGPQGTIFLRQLTPAIAAALDHLTANGAEEDRLTDQILDADGAGALAQWYYTLQKLVRRGLLCRAVHLNGQRLATLVPISPAFMLTPPSPCGDGPYLLSRFAYLRREDATMLLESPLAHARIVLDDDRVLAVVGALAKPASAREVSERVGSLSAETVNSLLTLLASAGMFQETEHASYWEFHDLLFHSRSRKGRCDTPSGATYRLAGRLPPPSAVKPSLGVETCELYRPNLEQLRKEDPPLTEVMERRRSLRNYDDRPLTVQQIGEFLYRIARVKEVREVELETPSGPVQMEFVSRPYPSGGALYELEIYVVVQACEGLAPGLYHYDGQQHRLARPSGQTSEVEQLLADAAASAGIAAEHLQVLFVLAARFQRLAWKYTSIAYALILKHVGVVYQTMYLTATAMDLAPCALGGGDADLFARAAGTDYYEETSVGEFLLGSKKK